MQKTNTNEPVQEIIDISLLEIKREWFCTWFQSMIDNAPSGRNCFACSSALKLVLILLTIHDPNNNRPDVRFPSSGGKADSVECLLCCCENSCST